MTAVRAFAFGDLDGRVWGAAWLSEGRGPAPVAVGSESEVAVLHGLLEANGETEDWRLGSTSGAAELALSPHTEAVRPASAGEGSGSAGEGSGGFDQLCRVSGRLVLDGRAHAVDCLGWRGVHREPPGRERPGSLRIAAAWFESAEGLAVVAMRPRRARGQESDLISAVLLGGAPAGPVRDPRLSTTYSEDGLPIRAGIELWVGDEEAGQHPRRAAGEALSAPASWTADDLELHARLFRWFSHGHEGAGVYLLGTRAAR